MTTTKSNLFVLNYKRMDNLGFFRGLKENKGNIKLQSDGFMDLILENYGTNSISMTHYYEQNGDLIPDPDMTIKIDHDLKYVEALTYQDSFIYQNVHIDDKGTYDHKIKNQLNRFLGQWLRNLKNQGFKYEKEKK
jgi:uncharacterized protein YqiB (DUF1249 family)